MSEIIPFLPAGLAETLTIMMGMGVMLSSMWRLYQIDLKINKWGYAVLHVVTALGGLGCVLIDPWGPLLVLLSVTIQHSLTDKLWNGTTSQTSLKNAK